MLASSGGSHPGIALAPSHQLYSIEEVAFCKPEQSPGKDAASGLRVDGTRNGTKSPVSLHLCRHLEDAIHADNLGGRVGSNSADFGTGGNASTAAA